MPLIGVEAGAASAVAMIASAIIAAYLADTLGFTIAPLPILALSLAVAAALFVRLPRRAAPDRPALPAFAAIVMTTLGWLMWRTRPDFLPTGSGSDLAHHLALLAYIERHGRLVHDATLGAYLGEMIDYTPGAHLLPCCGGVVPHRAARDPSGRGADGSAQGGVVFLIARRLMPDGMPRRPFAMARRCCCGCHAPSSRIVHGAVVPSQAVCRVVRSRDVGARWCVGNGRGRRGLFALCAAAFLTWPIWIGPLALMLGAWRSAW
jgi:hypothetical protein